jgi:hypothetical protein
MSRLFTHAEAEHLLPLLTDLLTELRDQVTELEAVRARLEALPDTARRNGHAVTAATLERQAAERVNTIRDLIARVEGLGVEIKDARTGLVDFRALREGRVVYLCWRLGEPSIAYWHELDTGFAGRQPLQD